jgi:hypothetical protein
MIYLSRATGSSANYNHIDLAFAREGEREVFAPILEWLQAHSAKGPSRASVATLKPRPAQKRNAPAKNGPARTKPVAKRATTKKRIQRENNE